MINNRRLQVFLNLELLTRHPLPVTSVEPLHLPNRRSVLPLLLPKLLKLLSPHLAPVISTSLFPMTHLKRHFLVVAASHAIIIRL